MNKKGELNLMSKQLHTNPGQERFRYLWRRLGKCKTEEGQENKGLHLVIQLKLQP